MSRIDREHLIERYLRGELSPAQEERFFVEIATNDELRHELKAYRVVEETLVRDSRRVAAPQTALRARLEQQMAGMQATAPATTAAATSAPAATGTVATTTMVPLKWFMAAVIGASLAVGGLVMSSLSDRTPFARTPSAHTPGTPVPGMIAQPQRDSVTVANPVAEPAVKADDAATAEIPPQEFPSRMKEQSVPSATEKKSRLKEEEIARRHTVSENQRRNETPVSLHAARNTASGRSQANGDTLERSARVPLIINAPKPIGDKP